MCIRDSQQTIETSIKAIELGARFILHSSDSRFMQSAMQEQMSHLRNRVSAISGKDFTGSVADTVETV